MEHFEIVIAALFVSVAVLNALANWFSVPYQRLLHELYTVQRRALVALRNGGEISNDVMHRLERELHLEEARLEI